MSEAAREGHGGVVDGGHLRREHRLHLVLLSFVNSSSPRKSGRTTKTFTNSATNATRSSETKTARWNSKSPSVRSATKLSVCRPSPRSEVGLWPMQPG